MGFRFVPHVQNLELCLHLHAGWQLCEHFQYLYFTDVHTHAHAGWLLHNRTGVAQQQVRGQDCTATYM